jgi:hypothetical protein
MRKSTFLTELLDIYYPLLDINITEKAELHGDNAKIAAYDEILPYRYAGLGMSAYFDQSREEKRAKTFESSAYNLNGLFRSRALYTSYNTKCKSIDDILEYGVQNCKQSKDSNTVEGLKRAGSRLCVQERINEIVLEIFETKPITRIHDVEDNSILRCLSLLTKTGINKILSESKTRNVTPFALFLERLRDNAKAIQAEESEVIACPPTNICGIKLGASGQALTETKIKVVRKYDKIPNSINIMLTARNNMLKKEPIEKDYHIHLKNQRIRYENNNAQRNINLVGGKEKQVSNSINRPSTGLIAEFNALETKTNTLLSLPSINKSLVRKPLSFYITNTPHDPDTQIDNNDNDTIVDEDEDEEEFVDDDYSDNDTITGDEEEDIFDPEPEEEVLYQQSTTYS